MSVTTDYTDVLSFGRSRIYTEKEINDDTILEILTDALAVHNTNVAEMRRLIWYYLGKQDILSRLPAYYSGVNNKVVINYAQSTVRDILGYTFGKDIEYIQRGKASIEDVEEFSNILESADSSLEDTITALFCSICGVGYQCTLPSEDYNDAEPEIGIKIGQLDPRYTLVVHSYDFKNPVVLACTYHRTKTRTVYTAYSRDRKYIIEYRNGKMSLVESKPSGLGGIPITMVENNHFLFGDFEPAITILDAINKVASDSVNDIENFVQSLLVFINASLGETEAEKANTRLNIKQNRMIEIKSPKGLNADAKYITQQLNPESTKVIREYLEECLWKVLGIPDRKTRGGGGGDTGDAVKLRDGWADIETVARNKEKFFKRAKREQVSRQLYLLKLINKVSKKLKATDIDIKFNRNKNDNLQTKSQSYSTLIATKTIAPIDCLEIADITTNTIEVIKRGEEYWRDKQEQPVTEPVEKPLGNGKEQNADGTGKQMSNVSQAPIQKKQKQ